MDGQAYVSQFPPCSVLAPTALGLGRRAGPKTEYLFLRRTTSRVALWMARPTSANSLRAACLHPLPWDLEGVRGIFHIKGKPTRSMETSLTMVAGDSAT